MENNTSITEIDSDVRQPWYMVFSTCSMIIMAVITIAGNVFVIVSVFTNKPLRTVPNFFIVSLAMADFFVAVFVMPFHISNNIAGFWIYGEIMCKIWLTSDVFLCTASILNLCIIALDRYWAIHDPITYAQKRTIKRVLIMICISWTLSGMISIPPVFGWGDSGTYRLYDDTTKSCKLSDDKGYVLYSACGSFYIPLLVMSFVYFKIFLATKKRLRQRTEAARTKMALLKTTKSVTSRSQRSHSDSTNDEANEATNLNEICVNNSETLNNGSFKSCQTSDKNGTNATDQNGSVSDSSQKNISRKRKDSKKALKDKARSARSRQSMHAFFEEKQRISLSKERKAARTLAIIMITFVLCWIPFFLLYLILPFCSSCSHPGEFVEVLFVWLGYVNSMLNPVIYTVFNMEFRKAFNDFVSKCCGKQSRNQFMSRTYV
ncbi:tyramine receptor 1-like [Ruditapes philippinarum]|uniref:tyramine receptor 1-like n=1 Tax=Ruditapes philippinarum TaxID=129788 RepID=UPI00295BB076|nr:tyramine receptor 1-like [Ruditapes philippinarum]